MLFECAFNAWSPRIGEPHVMGWLTVGFYFIVAMQTLLVSCRVKYVFGGEDERRNRLFWLLLLFLMMFLGLNKRFDLQSYFTAMARCSAHMGGWYQDRRPLQLLFIVSIAGLFTFAAVFLLWCLRGNLSHNFWAIIGVSFLMAFILIRAASFHDFDIVVKYEFAGIRMNWILEVSGILLISFQSTINLRTEKTVTAQVAV